MLMTRDIPDRIAKLKSILNELEESQLCMLHDDPDIRVESSIVIEDMKDDLERFNIIFNKSL